LVRDARSDEAEDDETLDDEQFHCDVLGLPETPFNGIARVLNGFNGHCRSVPTRP